MDEEEELVREFIDSLYELNWNLILQDAVKSRPTSWANPPIIEWKNAGECVMSATIRALTTHHGLQPIWESLRQSAEDTTKKKERGRE